MAAVGAGANILFVDVLAAFMVMIMTGMASVIMTVIMASMIIMVVITAADKQQRQRQQECE